MTIVYKTTGAWGPGTGAPLFAAQVDGNFYDVDQRLVSLADDLNDGKRIDHVEYSSSSMTFYYTDETTQVIPLPTLQMHYTGPWLNNTPYEPGDLFTAFSGFYQVLEAHVSPPSPSTFDPNVIDDSTAGNPLYALWMPFVDTTYDAAIFVPGSIQREADELIAEFVANRKMNLTAGGALAFAYLDIGNDGTGADDIIISIEKNHSEIGTITFAAGGDIDTSGGQAGVFSIPSAVDFIEGDRYGLRVTQSENAEPSGLSVTLPFIRVVV